MSKENSERKKPKRDHDNDPLYRKPTAWRQFKNLNIADIQLIEAMEELVGGGAVRTHVSMALFHYLTLSKEQRARAMRNYFNWHDYRFRRDDEAYRPLAIIPDAEAIGFMSDEVDRDLARLFHEAMERIWREGGGRHESQHGTRE